MLLLSQDEFVMTPSGKKARLTLVPGFVYMESLLSVMTYPGMTLKGFILFRDESFREIRELPNVADSVRTLDSVLLEVTKNADKILRTHQVVLAFSSVDKTKGSDGFSALRFENIPSAFCDEPTQPHLGLASFGELPEGYVLVGL
jgi:hypothetical protein